MPDLSKIIIRMGVLSPAERAYRASVTRVTNLLSFFISVVRPGKITFSEYLEELRELGLAGNTFGPECYRSALARSLAMRIEVILVDDRNDVAEHRAFVEQGHTAVIWYRPERSLAQILVLGSLSPLEMTAAVYHELSHLAAGHPLQTRWSLLKTPSERATPPRRIAKRPPPLRQRACETEARIREEYCLLAGALGATCLKDDDLRQVR